MLFLQLSSVNPFLPSKAYILSLVLTDDTPIRLCGSTGGMLRTTSHTNQRHLPEIVTERGVSNPDGKHSCVSVVPSAMKRCLCNIQVISTFLQRASSGIHSWTERGSQEPDGNFDRSCPAYPDNPATAQMSMHCASLRPKCGRIRKGVRGIVSTFLRIGVVNASI